MITKVTKLEKTEPSPISHIYMDDWFYEVEAEGQAEPLEVRVTHQFRAFPVFNQNAWLGRNLSEVLEEIGERAKRK